MQGKSKREYPFNCVIDTYGEELREVVGRLEFVQWVMTHCSGGTQYFAKQQRVSYSLDEVGCWSGLESQVGLGCWSPWEVKSLPDRIGWPQL